VYLLDTNVISELRKTRPHGGVVAWLQGMDERDLHLAAITLGEIQAGIEITREEDPAKAEQLEAWADQVCGSWNILPMDYPTFRLWAKLMHGQAHALAADAMIAATAVQHGLTVVTRNLKDFRCFKVELLNPFTAR
jgi:predicted nucleic acid-binding protein